MALISSYLISVKNVPAFFDSLIGAKAPNTFTQKFIEGLGFTSTNDRLFISLLKGLGFLDGNATPTERYFRFLDQSESKRVLSEAIEEAYEDLFAVNTKAHELPLLEVKNKLKTLTQGKNSDKVVSLMAATFRALSEYAEWSNKQTNKAFTNKLLISENIPDDIAASGEKEEIEVNANKGGGLNTHEFHYNIQIHLPESRDEAVYDVIFKSLRRHIL